MAPAPGGGSKRAADVPESRAIAELEGRGAVRPVPVHPTMTQTVRPCANCRPTGGRKFTAEQMGMVAGGAAGLVGVGAYAMLYADRVAS